jgi:hypothetical protein
MYRHMLRTLYYRAADGVPVLSVPTEKAYRLRQQMGVEKQSITVRAITLSGATGFVMGLPGYFAMSITVPSNAASVLLIQLHICATVAALRHHHPKPDTVRPASIRARLRRATTSRLRGRRLPIDPATPG